ncbi:galactose ABC transporter substrate-binding protein, partial [Clostridium perfringens]|nr:galactose ABC transporter substrate-binding protein [Clostridium perfringens]
MKKGKKLISLLSMILISTLAVGCNKETNITSKQEIKIGVTRYRQDDVVISTITKNLAEIAK